MTRTDDADDADDAYDEYIIMFTLMNYNTKEKNIYHYIEEIVMHGSLENIRDLFVMAFQTRDIRGGKGKRRLFYSFMKALHSFHPNTTRRMLHLVPEYGCWRDMWELWREIPALGKDILRLVKQQYIEDLTNAAMGDVNEMSLLAKWLPREKSATYRGFARWIARAVYPNERSERQQLILYRKETSFMNSKLKTVEVDMCAGRWRKITPETVPSRCWKLNERAFLNETTHGDLRHPDRSDRMKCRKHFLNAIQDSDQNVSQNDSPTASISRYDLLAILNDERYDPVRAVWRDSMGIRDIRQPTEAEAMLVAMGY
jgi:hypothetical protein